MTVYVVTGGTTTPVYPAGQQTAQTVKNTDLVNPVYVGDSPSVNDQTGYPLSPGSSIVWDSGKALFLYSKAGTQVNVNVTPNSGALFDAAAIAAQIKVSGVPPIDTNTILYNVAVPLGPAGTTQSTSIDVSQYQSVTIWVADEANTNAVRNIQLWWGYWQGNSFVVTDDDWFATLAQGPQAGAPYVGNFVTLQTPVKGSSLLVNVGAANNGSATANVHVIVTGSYKQVNKPRYNVRCDQVSSAYKQGLNAAGYVLSGHGSDGLLSLNINNPTNTVFLNFPSVNGAANLYADYTGTGSCGVQALDAQTQTPLAVGANINASTNLNVGFSLPMRPIVVYFAPSGSGAVRLALTTLIT